VRALEGGGGRRRVETVILPDGEQFKTLQQVHHISYRTWPSSLFRR
jgi:hypothetical protein